MEDRDLGMNYVKVVWLVQTSLKAICHPERQVGVSLRASYIVGKFKWLI
jgi:hypothetical protein